MNGENKKKKSNYIALSCIKQQWQVFSESVQIKEYVNQSLSQENSGKLSIE